MVPPGRERPDLGEHPLLPQLLKELAETAELKVAAKDELDTLSFLLVDDELLVPALVSEWDHAAHPQSAPLRGCDLIPDALGGDLPLELGEGQKHVQGQPSHAGRRIEGLGDRHERNVMSVEQLHELGEVSERARQTIDLVTTITSMDPACTSDKSRCRAGRSMDAPENPPSS